MQRSMVGRVVVALVFAAISACGGKQKVEETPPPPKPVQIDGHARLSADVKPTKYELDLTIEPTKETFSGVARIDVIVPEATHVIYLHAEDLDIKSATFVRRDEVTEAEARPGPNGGLAVVFAPDLNAGPGTLVFEYEAPLDEVPAGLFRVRDGDESYVFSQFQPLDARQAFPSFDEPKFKTPFEVTLRVPTGLSALSNAPEVKRATEGEWDVVQFAESKPLPTYLVAFAVGPFDIVNAPPGAIEGVELRLVAPKGKGELGEWMLAQTPLILQRVAEYFGRSYPYEKLDVVAVPNFPAAAMENVGLVTFRDSLLLLDPKTASIGERRAAVSVMAHELAHMWFGNLVTLAWWDDLWLNESFATWLGARVTNELLSELDGEIDAIRATRGLMDSDSRAQSRAIRQPIEHGGDVYNAFDGITYGKGARVLRMFEGWIGDEKFREGIRKYINSHEHGVATTRELLGALDAAAGKPVSEVISPFLDQPGTPLLEVALSCEEAPTLMVSQSRYLPAGSGAEATGTWAVPFCVMYPNGRETATWCGLLDEMSEEFPLEVEDCPAWIYPNAGQLGYYRWNLPPEQYGALTSQRTLRRFDDATKVEIFTNTDALLAAEKVSAEQWFSLLGQLAKEQHRVIVRQVVGALWQIDRVVDEANRARFAKVASRWLRPHLRRVGYEPKKRESVEQALLRPALVAAAAFLADDVRAKKLAATTTKKFLKDMRSVRSDLARTSLPISAATGDASLWLSYQMSLGNAPTPTARAAVIRGLGSFTDPELLQRSLELYTNGTLRSHDLWTLIGPTFDRSETYDVTWRWFTENYDSIVKTVGEKTAPRLPRIGGGYCDAEGREEVATFFADPARQHEGSERNLANTLERIDQCIRRKQYLAEGLPKLLR